MEQVTIKASELSLRSQELRGLVSAVNANVKMNDREGVEALLPHLQESFEEYLLLLK